MRRKFPYTPEYRKARLCALAGLSLFFVIFLFYLIENIRGGRALAAARADWKRAGFSFEAADYWPTPIPEDSNFAAIPLLSPLFADTHRENSRAKMLSDFEFLEPIWSDSNAPALVQVWDFERKSQQTPAAPSARGFATARRIDLNARQLYLRGTNQPPRDLTPVEAANDILAALRPFDGELSEFRSARASRPLCIYPVHYREGSEAAMPHLVLLESLVQITTVKSVAELRLGNAQMALDDCELGLFLSDSPRDDCLAISQLVRSRLFRSALQSVWEGLADRRWSDVQIARLQSRLEKVRFLNSFPRCLRGETRIVLGNIAARIHRGDYMANDAAIALDTQRQSGFHGRIPRFVMRLYPGGWSDRYEALACQFVLNYGLPIVNTDEQLLDHAALDTAARHLGELRIGRGYRWLEEFFLSPLVKSLPQQFAYSQTQANEAVLACALERHFLKFHRYPVGLDEVAPFLGEPVPHDVMGGEPLIYRRTADGRFIIYSIGWNWRDDGGRMSGTPAQTGKDAPDWVWAYAPDVK